MTRLRKRRERGEKRRKCEKYGKKQNEKRIAQEVRGREESEEKRVKVTRLRMRRRARER